MHCHSNELEIQQSAKVLIDLQSTCNMIVRQDNVNRTQPFARKPTSDTVITLTMHHPAEDSALPHLPSPSLFALNEMVTQNFSFTSDSSTAYTDNNSSSNDTSFESPLTKRRKTASLYRSSSLDRGKDTYTDWTGKQFELSAAISKETDTQDISQLWKLVNMPSGKDKKAESEASRPHYAKGTRSSANRTTTGTATSSRKSEKIKLASPYDSDFQQKVLDPRSIRRVMATCVRSSAHFAVGEPTGNRAEYYTQKRKAPESPIWLEPSDAFVTQFILVYTAMQREAVVEAEYATYAKETILKTDPQTLDPAAPRAWRTRRMIEMVAKPDETFWLMPPVVRDTSTSGELIGTYTFDLRPDCSYWISTKAINENYRSYIGQWCYVWKRVITWPYLTVEFKRDEPAIECAQRQVMAAGSLALYNRFLLMKKRVEVSGEPWCDRDTSRVRHYGLTMTGALFTVWCLLPTFKPGFVWSGCEMIRVEEGTCTEAPDVRKLIDWLNEIHCWGLTRHGATCLKDVKICLGMQLLGVRPSAIAPDLEDEDGQDALKA